MATAMESATRQPALMACRSRKVSALLASRGALSLISARCGTGAPRRQSMAGRERQHRPREVDRLLGPQCAPRVAGQQLHSDRGQPLGCRLAVDQRGWACDPQGVELVLYEPGPLCFRVVRVELPQRPVEVHREARARPCRRRVANTRGCPWLLSSMAATTCSATPRS
jgi:hypothetical protein